MKHSRILKFISCVMLLSLSASSIAESKLATESTSTISQSRRMQKFMAEGYEPPSQADEESRKMNELIEKINSMSLSRQKLRQLQEAKKAEKEAQAELKAQPKQVAAVETAQAEAKPATLPDALLSQICKQAENDLVCPIRLADALYSNGYKDEACIVYNKCLKPNISPNDTSWVIFQLANCQIDTKPAEARELLKQLVAEYPESPWSSIAKNQEMILQWRYQNKPRKTLQEAREVLDTKPDEKIENSKRTAQPRNDGQKNVAGQEPTSPSLAAGR